MIRLKSLAVLAAMAVTGCGGSETKTSQAPARAEIKKQLTRPNSMRLFAYRQPGIQNLAEGLMPFVLSGLDAQDMRKTVSDPGGPVNDHPAQSPLSLLRVPTVMARTGLCRASLYKRIGAGLFVRPVKAFGRQRAGWPSDEIEALIRAHVAGADESRIAQLVAELHARRCASTIEQRAA